MPVWQWLLDAAGVLLVLVVLFGVGLIVRRRLLSRHGGTFELSYRVRHGHVGRGWLLGLGRYSGENLEWFRYFSLWPGPRSSRSTPTTSSSGAPLPTAPSSSRCRPRRWSASSPGSRPVRPAPTGPARPADLRRVGR